MTVAGWSVLVAWWVVYPIVLEDPGAFWSVHLLVVAAFGLALVPRLWRSASVRWGPPALFTSLALVSLALATWVAHPEDLPHGERWWAALTCLAHCVFFLCALAVVPAAEGADGPVSAAEQDACRSLRLGLSLLLLAMVLAQLVTMVGQLDSAARPRGSLGNPNFLGALIAASGLALAAFYRWRPLALVTAAGCVLLLLLTRSRGAMAAGSAMLLLLAARRSWRAVLLLALALGALLVLVPNPLWERLQALRSEHSYSRLFLWKVALQNIAENPLGIGASMNKYVFPPRAFDGDFPWLLHQRHAVGLTHNVVLTVLLEWGWLAGAALAALAVWTGARLSAHARRVRLPASPSQPVPSDRSRGDPLGQGAVLAAGALLLELQVDGLEQNALAFSVFLLLVALCWQRAPRPPPTWRVAGRPVALGLALVCLGLATVALQRGRTMELQREAKQALNQWITEGGDEQPAREAVQRLLQRAADEPDSLLLSWRLVSHRLRLAERSGRLSGSTLPEGLLETVGEGTRALEAACAANPAAADLLQQLADWRLRLWRLAGRPPALLMAWRSDVQRLLAVDPLNVEARWKLAQEAQRAGRIDLFEAQLERLFEIEPDHALAWFVLGRVRTLEGRLEAGLAALSRAREALFNCRAKAAVPSPASRAFYGRQLALVDLSRLRREIHDLRRQLLD